jgi:hydrogenase maturation protein HypF
VRRRGDARLADEVAPGNPRLGLMLAYSPLHHLLLHAVGRPLVMTSGNLSDEPIALRNDEALARLQGLAELFLLHDREIETRCDDSVAQVVAGGPMVLRRSRGYVPRGVPLEHPVAAPVLAVGADLKNAICVAAGDTAWLGPHVGDLGSPETWRSLEEGTAKLLRFLQITPARIACDQHPDSIAGSFARQVAGQLGLQAPVRVQHHHAHVASAIAEHGLHGQVIGVAFDGTGWGPDGTLWGGEVLLADYAGYERLATLRPIPLPGGEAAIRQTWRVALAALDDAFGGRAPVERLPLFAQVSPKDLEVARRLVQQGFNAPLARGMGRVFDAAGAIALGRPRARHEGQVALDWNLVAGPAGTRRYPFSIEEPLGATRGPRVLDLRPLWRALCEDVLAGAPPAETSACFHDTLIEATATLVRSAAERCGRLPVVLTGGCFANARLAEGLALALSGFEVHLHRQVPPGDGGLALGQALVANAAAA